MSDPAAQHAAPADALADVERRVVAIARELAREVGGPRAELRAAPGASLERDLGLGSLERVELLARVERELGRSLDERVLQLDSAGEIAVAIVSGSADAPAARIAPAEPRPAPASALRRPAATLHEALWRRAEAEPERPQTYMREEDGSEHTISYARLLDAARAVAGGLRETGVRRGDTVALMLPTGFDFLRTFQGILIAGAIPVPIYPPLRLDRLAEYALRQAAILADARVTCLVTIPKALPVAGMLRPSVPSLRRVTSADELAGLGRSWPAPEGASGDPAFIQYTSGSTGQPKGVLLSHANLLANIRAVGHGLAARPGDVGVSWLPLYHDMGLIGSWLFCLHDGYPIDIQSPLSFLARPDRWLWAIHRRRGTMSAAPNFAYELCAQRIPDDALLGLDLSCWRCALNGAEPVQPDTLERFARRFERYGFRREALMPVYGLAECTVALCFPPPERGPRIDRVSRSRFETERRAEPAPPDEPAPLRFVSVGVAVPGHEVRLLDDAGQEVGERVVGRLAFRGPSASAGYFRNEAATRAISLAGGFLDSGDLAYRADGETFLCGRRKDLIIKGGRNFVPQEIEEATATVPGVRRGCVVAFGVAREATGTEELVVVAESRAKDAAERERIAAEVVEQVAAVVGVPPDRVSLVAPGAVPKTSSGKIRRAATREQYLQGNLGRTPRLALRTALALGVAALLEAVRPPARRAGRAVYAAGLVLALLPLTAGLWLLSLILPAGRPIRALERGFYWLALRLAGFRLLVHGRLPEAPGFLLVCNHASYLDIPALGAMLPMLPRFVAKREIQSWPLVGRFVRKSGHLTVERFETRESAANADKLARAIRDGHTVLVFPEGTFTAAAGLRPFRLGAFKAAVETGVPVVPLALRGTRRGLRDGDWIPRPGRIELEILPAVAAHGDGWRDLIELRDRVAEAVAASCGEPRLDLVAGGPPR